MGQGFRSGLSKRQMEALWVLQEECAEVIQAAAKVLRHGYESVYPENGPTNRTKLEQELGDLQAAVARTLDLDPNKIGLAALKKELTADKWLYYQESHA